MKRLLDLFCGKAGLRGGIFDTAFSLWPVKDDKKVGRDRDFFIGVEKYGITLSTPEIFLDGGAGN